MVSRQIPSSRSLGIAVLLNVCAMSVASAQQTPSTVDDFSGIAAGRAVTVISESGTETKGRLLRFTGENLSLLVKGREVVFERPNVSTVFERGDSVRDGMKIGAIAAGVLGAALGVAIATQAECGNNESCNAAENMAILALPTAVFGLVGMGAGAGFDALFSQRRRLYEKSPGVSISGAANDFTALSRDLSIVVIEDTDVETRGRLVSLTPDSLTVRVGGREHTIARQRVKAIFRRGDSVKNGVRYGFLSGAVLGTIPALLKERCGRNPVGIGYIQVPTSYSPCTTGEKVKEGVGVGIMVGLVGMGIGAGIDALIPGRRLIYERHKPTSAAMISIAPSFAPSRIGLSTSVSW